jgi:hypothetical protein
MSGFLSFLPLIIVVGLVVLIFRTLLRRKSKDVNYVCTNCGTKAAPQSHTKGSILIEIILWLAFIVPGLIYSIWRLTSRQQVCPACKKPTLIPLNTPAGQKYAREFAEDQVKS